MSPFELGPITFNISTSPSSPTPEQSFLSEVEAKAKDNPELAKQIKEAAEKAEKARRERIVKALEGAAELQLLEGPQGKRFVMTYFYKNEAYATPGIAYPGYDASKEDAGELEESTVYLQSDTDPFLLTKYRTMDELKKTMDRFNSPYVIKFFD